MRRENNYLVVWGTAIDHIRAARGENETVAMKYAFGMAEPTRMTCRQVTLYELRTDSRRTKLCYDLLETHALRMKDPIITKAVREARDQIRKQWEKAWKRIAV